MKDYYTNLTTESYDMVITKYTNFLVDLHDVNTVPISVYAPLTKKSVDDIMMLREMSRDLQKKKDEDMHRAAQAALQAEQEKEKETKEKETKEAEERAKSEIENPEPTKEE